MKTPIDVMFDKAPMACTVCDKAMGTCSCWTKCGCGWNYRAGESCNNPECKSIIEGK